MEINLTNAQREALKRHVPNLNTYDMVVAAKLNHLPPKELAAAVANEKRRRVAAGSRW